MMKEINSKDLNFVFDNRIVGFVRNLLNSGSRRKINIAIEVVAKYYSVYATECNIPGRKINLFSYVADDILNNIKFVDANNLFNLYELLPGCVIENATKEYITNGIINISGDLSVINRYMGSIVAAHMQRESFQDETVCLESVINSYVGTSLYLSKFINNESREIPKSLLNLIRNSQGSYLISLMKYRYKDALRDKFFRYIMKDTHSYDLVFILSICIYLYYIGYRENETLIARESHDLRNICKELLRENINAIHEIMLECALDNIFTEELYRDLNYFMKSWEISPEIGTAKMPIMSNVVREFIILMIVKVAYTEDIIKINLNNIVGNNVYSYYSPFLEDKNIDSTKEKISLFLSGFNQELKIPKEDVDKKFNIFKKAFDELYQKKAIDEARKVNEKFNADDVITEVELNLLPILSYKIPELKGDISSLKEGVKPKAISHKFCLLKLYTPTIFCKPDEIFKSIDRHSENILYCNLRQSLEGYLVKEMIDSSQNDFDADILKNMAGSYDCLVGFGFKTWKWSFLNRNKYYEIEKDKNTYLKHSRPGSVLALSSKLLSLCVKDVEVVISDASLSDFDNDIKSDTVLINITNDIWLPFEKNIGEHYIAESKKVVEINCRLEGKVYGDVCGMLISDTN